MTHTTTDKMVKKTWLRSVPLVAAPFLLLFAITQQSEIPWRYFFADLPIVLQVPIFACVITSTSTILWCSSGLIAIFTSTVAPRENRLSLLWLGILSLCLGIDDLTMVHETLLPRALGVVKKSESQLIEMAVFTIYGSTLATWLWKYTKDVPRVAKPFLVAACLCYALSITIDLAYSFEMFGRWSRFQTDYDYHMLVEDGPKFVGVVLWSLFCWHFSRKALLVERLSDDAN